MTEILASIHVKTVLQLNITRMLEHYPGIVVLPTLLVCPCDRFQFSIRLYPALRGQRYITNQQWVDQGFQDQSPWTSPAFIISGLNSALFLKSLPFVGSSFLRCCKTVKLYCLLTSSSRGNLSNSWELALWWLLFWKLLFKSGISQGKFICATLRTVPYPDSYSRNSLCATRKNIPYVC